MFDHFSSWFVLKSVKKWSNLKQSVHVLCQSSTSSSYCIEVIWNNSVSAGNSHSFHGFNGKHLWFWAANSPYFCHPFFRSPLGIQPRTIWILFRPHHHHPRAHIQAITVSSTFRGGYFFPKEKPWQFRQFGGACLSWIIIPFWLWSSCLQLLCTVIQIFEIRISFALWRKFPMLSIS